MINAVLYGESSADLDNIALETAYLQIISDLDILDQNF